MFPLLGEATSERRTHTGSRAQPIADIKGKDVSSAGSRHRFGRSSRPAATTARETRPEPQLVVELSGNGRCPGRLVSLVLVVVAGVDHRPLALLILLSSSLSLTFFPSKSCTRRAVFFCWHQASVKLVSNLDLGAYHIHPFPGVPDCWLPDNCFV